jgi:putative mRNA 3-end processing factor
VLAQRLPGAAIETLAFGERRTFNGRKGSAIVSLHPAGHVLGAAQVRIEADGDVWVVSGDYKRADDGVADPFELVPCRVFISECTFGLPIYRWPPAELVHEEIAEWWATCRERGASAVLGAYSLGKAQRVLRHLPGDGPILVHGAVAPLIEAHRAAGVSLPATLPATKENAKLHRGRAFVLAPPTALATPWLRSFGKVETGFASGWMRVRGPRRWRHADRGFVLSDHVDWPDLLRTVRETGCEVLGLTHGFVDHAARWFGEQGLETFVLATRFAHDPEGEDEGEVAS